MEIETRKIETPKNGIYLEDLKKGELVFLLQDNRIIKTYEYGGRLMQNIATDKGKMYFTNKLKEYSESKPFSELKFKVQGYDNNLIPLILEKKEIVLNPEKPLLVLKNGVVLGLIEESNKNFSNFNFNLTTPGEKSFYPGLDLNDLIAHLQDEGYEVHEQI